ncbi:unnamed protein product [Nesidiocoris tenuis]|uniref:Uncharacterized protein n=1 Tax=Nesidiocoris tenuis TaxID=355587 RepID=A0A6H5G2D4_9HEMI|nr:unnamed protein product [Nesidiocoris tenuis]
MDEKDLETSQSQENSTDSSASTDSSSSSSDSDGSSEEELPMDTTAAKRQKLEEDMRPSKPFQGFDLDLMRRENVKEKLKLMHFELIQLYRATTEERKTLRYKNIRRLLSSVELLILGEELWENLDASSQDDSPNITRLHPYSRIDISETITDRPRKSGSTTGIEFSRQRKDVSEPEPVPVFREETAAPTCPSVTKTGSPNHRQRTEPRHTTPPTSSKSKQTPTLGTSPSIRDRNQKIIKSPPAHLPDGRIDHRKCCEVCNQPGTSMRSWRCSACYHFWDRLIHSCKVGQPPPSCDHAIYMTSCRGCRRRRYEYLEGHRNPDFILPEPRPPNAAVDIGLQRRGECNGKMPPPPTA